MNINVYQQKQIDPTVLATSLRMQLVLADLMELNTITFEGMLSESQLLRHDTKRAINTVKKESKKLVNPVHKYFNEEQQEIFGDLSDDIM